MGDCKALRRVLGADRFVMIASFTGVTALQLVVGLILLYLFSYQHGAWQHLILPALTLGITGGDWYSRMMRSSLVNVLRQDDILTARAKDTTKRIVVLKP